MEESRQRRRANWIAAPEFFALNQACNFINNAFDSMCYLVGSSIVKRDHRDVDVRLILEDEEYDRMFKNRGGAHDAFWSLMCLTISVWLREQTKLPVDFQIQRQSDCNSDPDNAGKERHALGIFLDYPGKRPSDLKDSSSNQ